MASSKALASAASACSSSDSDRFFDGLFVDGLSFVCLFGCLRVVATKSTTLPMVPFETLSSVLFLINITFAPSLSTSSGVLRTDFFSVSTSFSSPSPQARKVCAAVVSLPSSCSLMACTLTLWVNSRVRLSASTCSAVAVKAGMIWGVNCWLRI